MHGNCLQAQRGMKHPNRIDIVITTVTLTDMEIDGTAGTILRTVLMTITEGTTAIDLTDLVEAGITALMAGKMKNLTNRQKHHVGGVGNPSGRFHMHR